MSDYRVMRIDDAYQIQQRVGKDTWEKIGEFDDINAAKKMVRELREGNLCA